MKGTTLRILVVEDDAVDQLAFRRAVRIAGLPYEITCASSLAEARTLLGSCEFDALVTDYDLGDGTALDVLAAAGDMTAIIVTGAGNQEKAVLGLEAGAADYLVKDPERTYLAALPSAIDAALRHKERDKRLRMHAHALMSIGDGVFMTSPADRIVFVNRAFCEMYGYDREEAIGRLGDLLWCERAPCDVLAEVDTSMEVDLRGKSGALVPVSLTRARVVDDAGRVLGVVRVTRDVGERRRAECALRDANAELERSRALLAEVAIRDDLTGLYNRRELVRALREQVELSSASSVGPPTALVLLDIDHFKSVNDRYGHPVGDDVLRHVSRILQRLSRPSDCVARYGGEEFALLLRDTDLAGAVVVAERLREAIATATVRGSERLIAVTASFGVASLEQGVTSERAWIQQADERLYAAKAAGRNCVFAAELRAAA